MDYVYFAHALDDEEALQPLSDLLRAAGWDVRFGAQIEPGPNQSGRIANQIDAARAVIAVWSGHSTDSISVQQDAQRALDQGKLVSLQIAGAQPPVKASRVVEAVDLRAASEGRAARSVLTMLSEMPGVPAPPVIAPVTTTSAPAKTGKSKRTGALVVAALGLAAIGGLGALFALPSVQDLVRGAGNGAAGRQIAPMPAANAEPYTREAQAEEYRAWNSLRKDDPVAIRAFLLRFASGPSAIEAKSALANLERVAWERVNAVQDSATTLLELEVFRANFPEGAFAIDAKALEQRERDRVGEAQRLLVVAGQDAGPADGILRPQTSQAVRAYQTSIGLQPTGLIDGALLTALRARAGSGSEGAVAAAGPTAAPVAAEPVTSPATAGTPFRDCYVCPELAPLPSGQFMMGDATGLAEKDESPAHLVKINYRLAVGRFEVTFDEWDACVDDGGCRHRPSDNGTGRGLRPVVNVSPTDIAEYLSWLERRSGKRYRLLSESEWEYAARAGTTSAWHSGNDSSAVCAFGNGADAASDYTWRNTGCSDGYSKGSAPVGSFKANAFGLHDMIGNVWEFTADCWHAGYEDAPTDGSAWVRECENADWVLRGGAYSVDVDKMRSSYRYHFAPKRMPFFGFRVARVYN